MGDVQGGYNTGSGCFGADGIRDQESRQRRSVRARKDRTTVPRSQTGTTRPIQSENYTRYIHSPSIKPNYQTCPSHPHLTFSLALLVLPSHPNPFLENVHLILSTPRRRHPCHGNVFPSSRASVSPAFSTTSTRYSLSLTSPPNSASPKKP